MKLRERQWIIGGIFLLISVIYLGRLVQMQVFAHEWKAYASRLTEETETLEPARGLIRDRHGEGCRQQQSRVRHLVHTPQMLGCRRA